MKLIKNHKIVTAVIALGTIGSIGVTDYAQSYEPEVENLVISQTGVKPVKEPVVEPVVEPELKDEPTPIVEQEVAEIVLEQPMEVVVVGETEPPVGTVTSDNPYISGGSLWYLYGKRQELGKQVGLWGHAPSWPSRARSQGIPVDNVPVAGSTAIGLGGAYHVESVDGDNINLSYMADGLKHRTMTRLEARSLLFIH